MRRFACIVSLALIGAGSLAAEEFTLESLPATEEAFTALRDRVAGSPEGGAVVMLAALMKLSEDKAMGLVFLTIALDRSALSTGSVYKGYKPGSGAMFHIDRLLDPSRKGAVFSYVLGTRPENEYAAVPPYRFGISRNPYSIIDENTIKVFVECSGAASARPMTLRRNDKGLWKALEFSSFSLDVARPPVSDDL